MGILVIVAALASCGRVAPTFEPGNIAVTSAPAGAAIFLNGQDSGKITPFSFVGLDADLYEISVILPDFISTPTSIPVDLAPLDDITLDFALSQTGLSITSEPAGAAINIDGTDTGQVTPATIGGLSAGQVEIALSLDTYLISPAVFTADVTEGAVSTVPTETFTLRPQRTVILEGFANTNCGPCPQLTDNLVAMSNKPQFGPDRVLYLEFSVNWPNPADPLFLHNQSENTDRFTDYFVLGAPALYTNGVQLDDALDAPAMEASLLADLQTDPGFRVDVTADFTNPSIPVTVTLEPAANVDLTGTSLFVALYERVIDFDERGLTPGTNGQTVFHHVFRDRVGTPAALGLLTAGSPVVHNVTLARGDWPLENLVVVAFAQRDSDHAIIQAGSHGEEAESGGTP
ncbi:MAG: PEGA domain-containing protein [Candidatus Krumholzibacteria bacterium]|nr:PEGA domain-containing protein [Candidatus Krumholzibacteria bacterium]